MWKKQPNTMEMTYSTILCTLYGFYFFPKKWSAHWNYGNYYHLSLHMHFHSWEAVETGGRHGVQTNALVHRGKLILFLEVPFHSEEQLCRTVSQESKANGGLTKNTLQTMKVTAVEENVSPVIFPSNRQPSLHSSGREGWPWNYMQLWYKKSVYVQN